MTNTASTRHLQINSMAVRCGADFDLGTASADLDRVTCPICRPSLAVAELHPDLRIRVAPARGNEHGAAIRCADGRIVGPLGQRYAESDILA